MRHETLAAPPGSDAAQRGEAILEQARAAFVSKGFDGASMQDLARAVGMSAGNFYRYFPSKAAIVEAMAERDIAEVEAAFQAIAASGQPLAALRAALRQEMAKHCGEDNVLWAEIAASATRRPEIASILVRFGDTVARRVAQVLGMAAGLPEEAALARFGAHGRLIFLILHGAMTSPVARNQPRDEALDALVLRAIDRVMDDALAGHAAEPGTP